METSSSISEPLLLIDTCGETVGVAFARGRELVGAQNLEQGNASAQIIASIRNLLTQSNCSLRDLRAIGVVNGPGSFTGTRAGLATAKGLCEAANLPLAAVSRLQVLANSAGLTHGYAALDAGRQELYVREIATGREWLSTLANLRAQGQGQQIAIAELRLQARLEGCHTILQELHAADALGTVLLRLREGGSDVALTDANYVRQESDIYRKPSGAIA